MAGKLFISIYLDEDVSSQLAKQLRRHDVDVQTTQEVGQLGATDENQLRYAASNQRVIVTYNQGHFARMYNEWYMAGKEHWGIIIANQSVSLGEILRRLLQLLNTVTADEMRNQLRYLSDFR